jgi:hypothetical protein
MATAREPTPAIAGGEDYRANILIKCSDVGFKSKVPVEWCQDRGRLARKFVTDFLRMLLKIAFHKLPTFIKFFTRFHRSPYPESHETSPYHHILLMKDPF